MIGTTAGCRQTHSATASEQIGAWVAEGSGRNRFTLAEIQELPPWTALYIFAPYTPTSTIHKQLGFGWPDAKRFNLDAREGIHLAVFVSGTNVVHVEEWKRDRFDCRQALTGHILLPSKIIKIDRTKPVPTLAFAEPDGAANGSQPIRSETNRTPPAAGPRR